MATWAAGSVEARPVPWAMCLSAQNPSWEMIRAVLLPNFWEGYGKKESEKKKEKKKGRFLLYREGFLWIWASFLFAFKDPR